MTVLPRSRAALAALVTATLFIACSPVVDVPSAPLAPPSRLAAVAVPAQGASTSLDIANWNVEWFGDAANGPANEATQQANVRDVIASADADIWGLEEVVTASAWSSLKAGLPGYAGVLSSDANVTNGSTYYSSTEQKVAVLYKTSIATFVSAKLVCTSNDFDFAGRPPLEVTLDVNLNGATERLVVIVLHNKAFNDAASRTRRQNAAACLKSYLDTAYPTQKVAVVGDWNDDVDVSITPGAATPFANFVNDGARYTYPTKALTDAGIASTTGYPDFIDHQLATNELMADYVSGSAHVVRADQFVTNYAATTTDHYPVVSRWSVSGGTTPPPPPPPPPSSGQVIINEIMANEPGSSTAGEYVELVNVGGTAASIGGWTISDGTAVRHTFAAGTMLQPGKAIVVFAAASGIPAGTPNAIASSTGSLNLANAGDQVVLKNGTTVIDSFTYPSSLAGTDGVSMNRSPDASAAGTFVLHTVISSLKGSAGTRATGATF